MIDVDAASGQIDALVERRSAGRDKANAVEEMWRASERRHREKRRRENAALWYSFYLGLAEAHAKIAAGFEEKAATLLDDDGKEKSECQG